MVYRQAYRPPPFVDFSSKSCFSFLKGASHPQELIQTASRLGYAGLALTDDDGFCGLVRAHTQAQELHFHLIAGTEITLRNDDPSLASRKNCGSAADSKNCGSAANDRDCSGAARGRVILIAKNITGYQQVCRFLSTEFLKQKNDHEFPIFSFESLSPEHVAILLPARNFISLDSLQKLCRIHQPFQLVTSYHSLTMDRLLKERLQEVPKTIPRLWTWDSHYHEQSRHELYEILRSIRKNQPLSKIAPSPNGEHYLKATQELEKLKVPREWLLTALKLKDQCVFSPKELRYSYPQEWLPPGKTADLFLRDLCEKGSKKRFPHGLTQKTKNQLEHELALIKKLHFEDYFLTVWDIVSFARSKNILCQGRGSAANSIVCYLLEITAIDPVKMSLLFERFISEERNEAPDIDIDFEHERREEVIQYVYQKYGRHRAGLVATLITYRTKSALRDCGKALEIPSEMIEKYSRGSSWRENIFEWKSESDPKINRWLRLSQTLKGFPRHLGQHTGGMILTENRLDEVSPLQAASMENRSCVQWDKYDIEDLGLLKIDLLSLGILTALRKSFVLIEDAYGIKLHLHTLPSDDTATYAMIQKAKTLGVFQIESRAQMSMLPRLQPKNFYDLVIEVGIVRPGPIQGGMVHPYLRRRLGLEKVSYADPRLRPILERTLGIPLFQEQVMKMAIDIAGYSPGEADALRRSMGAWKKTGNLEVHAKEMADRLVKNGIPEAFASQICRQILGFGEYGFPESHAASFALLTYASAYIKAHYPEAFLCSLLNSMPLGFYPFHMLTFDFQRDGGTLLPVDPQFSEWDHILEKIDSEKETKQFGIRLGFRCVRNLQREHVQTFIEKRKIQGPNLMIFDSRERASLAMTASLEEKRKAYWEALKPHQDTLSLRKADQPSFSNPSPLENLWLDFKFTETTLGTHPIVLAKKHQWPYRQNPQSLQLAEALENQRNHSSVLVFGMIQVIQSPPTAHGMCFITLEDESGYLNLVLTPPIFQKYKAILQSQWALLVAGKLQNQSGSISILVTQIMEPQQSSNLRVFPRAQHPRAAVRLNHPNAQELLQCELPDEEDDGASLQSTGDASAKNLVSKNNHLYIRAASD